MPLSIHLNRDVGTCSQRGHEQLVRVRTRVITADIAWFIGLERMRANGYILGVFQRPGIYGYISGHSLCSSSYSAAHRENSHFVFLEGNTDIFLTH